MGLYITVLHQHEPGTQMDQRKQDYCQKNLKLPNFPPTGFFLSFSSNIKTNVPNLNISLRKYDDELVNVKSECEDRTCD